MNNKSSTKAKALRYLGGVLGCIMGFAQAEPSAGSDKSEANVPSSPEAAKKEHIYRPTPEGIEIENGTGRFNRPLYSSVDRPWRQIAMAGERPEFMLMQISAIKSMNKLANLKLGLADGPWLDEVTPVLARYDKGLQDYRLGEKDAGIEVAAVRARAFEGLLLRVRSHRESTAPLVLAIGGRGSSNYDQNPSASAFNPDECRGTELAFADNTLTLSGRGSTVYATGSAPLRFTSANPHAVANGPQALLEAPVTENAVAALAADWPENGELYFILTADAPDSAGVKAFRADAAKVFADAVEDNRKLATTIEINTPDPYLDAALTAMNLGYDAAWNAPTFRHGAIAWHDSYAGWRVTYGSTTAGWHDRVQSHMHAFYGKMSEAGRIPPLLNQEHIYNMGEVLVDQALYDYEWTGDLEPLTNGGFDAIARHLAWGEKHVKTPQGLYENFLNAWNTDYKWCNGGGGTIASTYYWRANKTMAEIAVRLGKDPALFEKRASEIAAAMKSQLWSERVGVYGEYRDTLGNKLLHESPDLSSIYTPIDLGFCDPFESYRMLRFALRRFETIRGLPRDGALIYSSEWIPNHYSTRDIYTAEIINTLLVLYRTGQAEAAEPFRRALDGSFFTGPGPGSTGYIINPDGTYKPHTDFTDTSSMYIRNVVEGLFGVQMRGVENRIVLQPSFPREWEHASIRCPAVEYQYAWDGNAETMAIKTPRALSPTIRLRAHRAEIAKVTVNGEPAKYAVEPGIGLAWIVIEAPPGTDTQVSVTYGDEALPKAVTPEAGMVGEACTVSVDRGRIESVRQSRSPVDQARISGDGTTCSFPLPSEVGVATYFVQVQHRDVRLWVPVEVDVRPAESAPQADDSELQARTMDLSEFQNQRLADLHENTYTPRIEPFYWAKYGSFNAPIDGLRTVQANGRIWWETRRRAIRPDTSILTAGNGRIVASDEIPFAVPAAGDDAVFTSMYENFPERVEIPVNQRARKLAVLVAASIPISQSRMDNGRIRVNLNDGTHRDLVLRNPDTIDDWLGSGLGQPYAQSGEVVPLGKDTHARLHEVDLGADHMIKSVELETFTNETMIGLLGITLMQSKP